MSIHFTTLHCKYFTKCKLHSKSDVIKNYSKIIKRFPELSVFTQEQLYHRIWSLAKKWRISRFTSSFYKWTIAEHEYIISQYTSGKYSIRDINKLYLEFLRDFSLSTSQVSFSSYKSYVRYFYQTNKISLERLYVNLDDYKDFLTLHKTLMFDELVSLLQLEIRSKWDCKIISKSQLRSKLIEWEDNQEWVLFNYRENYIPWKFYDDLIISLRENSFLEILNSIKGRASQLEDTLSRDLFEKNIKLLWERIKELTKNRGIKFKCNHYWEEGLLKENRINWKLYNDLLATPYQDLTSLFFLILDLATQLSDLHTLQYLTPDKVKSRLRSRKKKCNKK